MPPNQLLFPHPCALPEHELLESCELRFTRRKGPGGQHRNKTATAAVFIHRPTGTVGEAAERRSQAQNRAVAFLRLRVLLALRVRSPWSLLEFSSQDWPAMTGQAWSDQPGAEIWRRRMLETTQMVSPEHWDYPVLLYLVFDALTGSQFHMAPAAQRLAIRSAQLSRLLRLDSLVLGHVNHCRQKQDMGSIR